MARLSPAHNTAGSRCAATAIALFVTVALVFAGWVAAPDLARAAAQRMSPNLAEVTAAPMMPTPSTEVARMQTLIPETPVAAALPLAVDPYRSGVIRTADEDRQAGFPWARRDWRRRQRAFRKVQWQRNQELVYEMIRDPLAAMQELLGASDAGAAGQVLSLSSADQRGLALGEGVVIVSRASSPLGGDSESSGAKSAGT